MIIFKKLIDNPCLLSPTPSGIDLHSPCRRDLNPGDTLTVGSGYGISIPKGYVGILFPRSQMALKKKVQVHAQLIHHDFDKELQINLHNNGKDLLEINKDEAIAQLIVVPCLTDYMVE